MVIFYMNLLFVYILKFIYDINLTVYILHEFYIKNIMSYYLNYRCI